MTMDTLSLGSAVGKEELAWLQTLKVGEGRKAEFLSGLPSGEMKWVCTAMVEDARWDFDLMFFGIVVMKVRIDRTDTSLLLSEVTK